MSHRASDSEPVDLGTCVAPDPFWVQPGVILLERFCVIGHVRHSAETWRVPVTDLRRELGAPPHHRFDLHFLPVPRESRPAVRALLGAHQSDVHRLEALAEVEHGLVLFAAPGDLPPLAHPLRADDALTLARVLAGILAAAHRAGIVGVRFDTRDLRIDAYGQLQFAAWRHLVPVRFAGGSDPSAADLRALAALLATIGSPTVSELLADPPKTAMALADRLAATAIDEHGESRSALLPAIPPFVGRDAELLAVHQAVARVVHGGPEAYFVTGGPGSGRSRFLDELALDFGRGVGILAIQGRFRREAPSSGLGVLLNEIADAIGHLPTDEQRACVARMLEAVGASVGLVASLAPKLWRLLDADASTAAPTLPLDEDFIRRCAAAAELVGAIGTARRPLVLLLDDLHLADASSRAVLYQLLAPGRSHHLVVVFTGTGASTAGLARRPVVIQLSAWSEATIGLLVRALFPDAADWADHVAARLADLTGGAPGAVWQRLQAWVSQGALARDRTGRWTFDDRAAVRSNVLVLPSSWSSLSTTARQLALLVALRADPVAPAWLASVTGWDRPPIREAVGTMLERGILVQDPGGRLTWSEDSARQHLIADASPSELRDTHALLASWLAQVDGSVAQRAWHREHATPEGADDALADLHLAAGREHLGLSNAERASWHFERALVRTARPDACREALEGRADARLLQDRTAEALEDYLAVLAEQPAAAALMTANRAVHALYLRGALEGSLALARAALATTGQRLPSGFGAALVDVLRAIVRLSLRRRWPDGAVADELALLHSTLVASVAASHPYIGLSSVFLGMAAAVGRSSGPSARARAFFSVLPATVGLRSVARALVDAAEPDARGSGNPMYVGVVLHFRGQNELGFGNYAAGQEALRGGIEAFRLAGDLSVAVISMAMATFYALDREPVDALLARIDEAETTAWRQRNQAVLPGIRGMRLWVLTRAGRIGGAEVERLAAEVTSEGSDLLGAVVGDSLTALALTRSGRPGALERAARARALLDRATGRPPFLEVALLAEAAATDAVGEVADANRAVARLTRRAKRVAGLRVACEIVRARRATRAGELAVARELLVKVIEDLPAHQEIWHVLDAHLMLAEILAGREPLISQSHTAFADEIRARLGATTAPVAPPERTPVLPAAPDRPVRDTQPVEVAMWELVDVLEPTLRRAFPGQLAVDLRVNAGVKTLGDAGTIELLVVNLALAARDAVGQTGPVRVQVDEAELSADEAARLRDARAGRWARVRVGTEGRIGPATLGALRECRSLCSDLSGFLEIDEDVPTFELTAYLPAPDGSPRPDAPVSALVVVVHRDEGVRRSLLDGIARCGCITVALPPGEPLPEEASIVFVEGALRHLVTRGHDRRIVAVVRRGQAAADGAPIEGEQLAVPYLVHELEGLLTRHRAETSPSGAGPRSG